MAPIAPLVMEAYHSNLRFARIARDAKTIENSRNTSPIWNPSAFRPLRWLSCSSPCALAGQLHAGEKIARHLGLIPADGLGLIIRPLIGSLLLLQQLFGSHEVARHGHYCEECGNNGHACSHVFLEWVLGLFDLFLEFFFDGHLSYYDMPF